MITGGGTAGHVYPALSVVDVLRGSDGSGNLALTWVGRRGGLEEDIVRRSGIAFRSIGLTGGVRGVGALTALRSAAGLVVGFFQAIKLIRTERPQAILATGGYVSAPAVLAGWLLRVPTLLYLPDMTPGWAVRFLAPLARRIAVTTDESVRYFKREKVFVSGYPVRASMFGQDRKTARASFGLDADARTILVVGGSRGAHSINVVVSQALPDLLFEGYQVIHVTGQADIAELRARRDGLPAEQKRRYRPYGFLHDDMARAFAAADLVVGRAGASVLGEIPAAGVAAILVPYAGGHRDQERNADFLAERGAAVRINDADLTGEVLRETIGALMPPDRLASMRQAAAALARPDAARLLADEVVALARR